MTPYKMQNLIYEWVGFSKFSQRLKFKKIFWKFLWFCSKFCPKLSRLVYEWVTFSWKIGICMGLLSNSTAAHPYQNQTWVPPPPRSNTYVTSLWFHFCHVYTYVSLLFLFFFFFKLKRKQFDRANLNDLAFRKH